MTEQQTFTDYVLHHATARSDPQQDFLDDSRGDRAFRRRQFKTYEELAFFLQRRGACQEARQAGWVAWNNYARWTSRRQRAPKAA